MSEEEAQYALECVLSRMQEDELRRVLESLPSRALEHIRLTAADFPGPAKPPEVTDDLPF